MFTGKLNHPHIRFNVVHALSSSGLRSLVANFGGAAHQYTEIWQIKGALVESLPAPWAVLAGQSNWHPNPVLPDYQRHRGDHWVSMGDGKQKSYVGI
jgi:hypothetical protein